MGASCYFTANPESDLVRSHLLYVWVLHILTSAFTAALVEGADHLFHTRSLQAVQWLPRVLPFPLLACPLNPVVDACLAAASAIDQALHALFLVDDRLHLKEALMLTLRTEPWETCE